MNRTEFQSFVEQLVLFRKQERWIIAEFKKAAKHRSRKRMRELSMSARQWSTEYYHFIGEHSA